LSGVIQAFFCKINFASSKTCRREYIKLVLSRPSTKHSDVLLFF
jgi:hypothetical protein